MSDNAGKNVDAKKGQRNDEHVEKAIVSFSNAVAHPRTVVIKTFCFHKKMQLKFGKKMQYCNHLPTQLSQREQ